MRKSESRCRKDAAPTPCNPDATCPSTATGLIDEPPWLLNIEQLSFLLNRSIPSLERDAAAGRLPAAVRIGGSRRWRRRDILEWVEAGCPTRSDQQATSTGRIAGE